MNKTTYIKNVNEVNVNEVNFIKWIIPKIDNEHSFQHKYFNRKTKENWSCNSIYNAYEKYKWGFKCTLPNNELREGDCYQKSEAVLKIISDGLRKSLKERNAEDFLAYCTSALKWGGVTRSNVSTLQNMKDVIGYFEEAIDKLSPKTVDINSNFDKIHMNSGFTKIYSLLIDDFVIYDSRVGAALGYLVRQFLEETEAHKIPDVLDFAYGNSRINKGEEGKINRRNPSSDKFIFKALHNNNPKRHIKNNIYANWLLKEIAENSKFNNEENSMRKLESALFMIGYSLRGSIITY